MFKVTEDIIYVGVNDHEVDLFEGQYDVPMVCLIIPMLFLMKK